MYFNKNNKFYHGIMFHHFHDDKVHLKGQGSIDENDFKRIIEFIGRKNILDANVFFEKLRNNKLKDNEVCLTFDDALKCQIDVALPILEELKIKSFFFVYSSLFESEPDNLELFRHFRMNYFDNINAFYDNFYKILEKDCKAFLDENNSIIKEKKIEFPNYSIEDIKFRLVRDIYLTKTEYEKTMFEMFRKKNFNKKDISSKLFFKKDDLILLDNLGHTIGLHSHSHPTLIEKLNYEEQKKE